jgi:hypothetical protein
MPFPKGKSGNPAGKKKGTKNAATAAARDLFTSFMEAEIEHIPKEMEKLRKLGPKEYLRVVALLMPYFMPKQTEMTLEMPEALKPPSWKFSHDETA